MYFVYRHIRLDINEPFYVGVGKGREEVPTDRHFYGRAYSKQRSAAWKNITAKTDYRIDIIFEHPNREIALDKEIEFIRIYGRIGSGGTLCNLTSGGQYCVVSKEVRFIIAEKLKGNKNGLGSKASEYSKKCTSERFKGNTNWKGRTHLDSSKLKIAYKLKGKQNTLGHRDLNKSSRSIICVETGHSFPSICECVRHMFKCNFLTTDNRFRAIKNSIIKVCKNKSSQYKGFTFKYI